MARSSPDLPKPAYGSDGRIIRLSCLQCPYVANSEPTLAEHLADVHGMDMVQAVERARAIAKDASKLERQRQSMMGRPAAAEDSMTNSPAACTCGQAKRHAAGCPRYIGRKKKPPAEAKKRRPVTRRSAPVKPSKPTKTETNGQAPSLIIRDIQTRIAQLEDGIATLRKAAAILEAMDA